jgi:hypothetical protein
LKALKAIYEEIAGLFVDDGNLALWSVLLIVVAAGLVKLTPLPPIWAGLLLVVGCLAILAESVLRAVRASR